MIYCISNLLITWNFYGFSSKLSKIHDFASPFITNDCRHIASCHCFIPFIHRTRGNRFTE